MTNKAKMLRLAFILVGVAIKAGARPERLGVSIDLAGQRWRPSGIEANGTGSTRLSLCGPSPRATCQTIASTNLTSSR